MENETTLDAQSVIFDDSFNHLSNKAEILSITAHILKSTGTLKMRFKDRIVWANDKAWRKKYKSEGFQYAMYCNEFETEQIESVDGVQVFQFKVRSK